MLFKINQINLSSVGVRIEKDTLNVVQGKIHRVFFAIDLGSVSYSRLRRSRI